MSFRQRGFFGRRRRPMRPIVDSIKNVLSATDALVDGATTSLDIARAVDSAATAVVQDVEKGCKIFRIWTEFWVYPSATVAEGVTLQVDAYIWKNPGSNLTAPSPGTTGTSNEKKFIFKEWRGLLSSRTQGGAPYTWKGWIKIPKVYQRMGTDDQIELIVRVDGVAGLICRKHIYKWFK